jgi:uncharacterized protein (TIGR02646 family)
MIPVKLQPEPDEFDMKVRKRGHSWIKKNGLALNQKKPKTLSLPAYWRDSNKQLWEAYSGVCAYLAIYFEWVTGANSTDHFIAKSRHVGDAYEWKNFRLSCLDANRKKNIWDDVLDPIGLADSTFLLNLASGEIRPNLGLHANRREAAQATINRLKLDSPEHRKMRAAHFSQYLHHKHEKTLKDLNPFVWYEAQRQGLL